jgi:pyruvate/2-oxoglutarate dehydrogenase complex dihydrolipoamide dehydrogenase (E3) component
MLVYVKTRVEIHTYICHLHTHTMYLTNALLQCVPSKALLRVAKAIREVRRASQFGIHFKATTTSTTEDDPTSPQIEIDFPMIMRRMRQLRSQISPADGHDGTTITGAHVYQGFGKFTSPNTIQVRHINPMNTTTDSFTELTFNKAVIATGGRPAIPTDIEGLTEAPYTTNEILFNLETLPPRMIVLGAGIIALEMAQCFATFGSQVTVLQRSTKPLFASTQGDTEAAKLLQDELEESGVQFIQGTTKLVTTVRAHNMQDTTQHPLMRLSIEDSSGQIKELECECLLIAIGRVANVENIDLEKADVQYEIGKGIIVNDYAQSVSNPNVYAVGDCVAGVPRLTHMSGEMAKLVVQNSLFRDDWKLSSLVVPAVMYTEPEYATVGISSIEMASKQAMEVDTYRTGLEHNDRAILESSNRGFVKIFCHKGTDEIVGATIVAERAGEMINEITLAMKNNIGLRAIGRNVHSYPTTGEAVMGCGIQYINANWERFH